MRKTLLFGAFAIALVAIPSVVHAQSPTLPAGVGLGYDCFGDDNTPVVPPGGVSNVLAMKRSQWGPTNTSTVQGLKVWCRLSNGISQTKLRVKVYDRNPGTTEDTSVTCHAMNLDNNGNTVGQETAHSGAGGVGSGPITITFNTFSPYFTGGGTFVSMVECTLPPSVDPAWASHLLYFYVDQ